MKKKLSFLSVLKLNRSVYLLDEPFNGVDIESTIIMQQVILKLIAYQKIVLLTSHIENNLKELCDQIFVMENAQTHFSITKDEFEHYIKNLSLKIGQKIEETLITPMTNDQ